VAVTSTAIVHAGQLVTNDETRGGDLLGSVRDGAVVFEAGRVQWVGESAQLPQGAGDTLVDAEGRCVLPGFVDSHSHLVFAGDRVTDFVASTTGASYEPAGIRSTVRATRSAPTETLAAGARRLRHEALRSGTTTMETKSGYGLTTPDEVRGCAVASDVFDDATFLGAHVVPEEFDDDSDAYVALVTGEMLAACSELVRFVDVFCERGAFDEDQARAVLRAGAAVGLHGKVHANQLEEGPGVLVAVEEGALTADHCTYLSGHDVDLLASGTTVATLLPITEFATRTAHADGRRLLDAGARVALATNCNPGSSYSTSMPLAIALAVRHQGLTPDQAIAAATKGGAAALGRDDVGVLRVGARADVVVLEAPSPAYLAYRPGVELVARIFKDGVDVGASH
jgi:imidazolonepropionase